MTREEESRSAVGVSLTGDALRQLEDFRVSHRTQVLTILFSDLVDSTGLQCRLGNVRAAEVVAAHRRVFREALTDTDGEEVETAGDSFLVVFAAPSVAVRFALRMQSAMREARGQSLELPEVRVGIHQGQVVTEHHSGGPKALDIYGLQVSTAARIMDLASGGQILCSRVVFDDARAILRPEDLEGLTRVAWCNHGPYRFQGVEDPHEVCEAGEEGIAPLTAPPATGKSWPADLAEEELGWRPAAGVGVPDSNWVLTEKLGQGAFGEVWRAHNTSDKSDQVYKFCFRRDRVPALKREARLLKRLRRHRHPNLVEVFDVTEGDRPPHFLEMEYVEGPGLDAWLSGSPGLKERLEVVAQVADALDTVHAAGICHRDIKPSNILLTRREDGAILAKLTDFGLGDAADADLLKSIVSTRESGVAGTWDYIAPEVREGRPATAKSDLFSLGLTLYQIVVGDVHRPLTGDWREQIGSEVLREDIGSCIAQSEEDRWSSAGELATALRAHDQRLRERELRREHEAQRRKTRKLVRLTIFAGIFALVTLVLGAVAVHQRNEADRQRKKAERLLDLAISHEDFALEVVHRLTDGAPESLRRAPGVLPVVAEILAEVLARREEYLERIRTLERDTPVDRREKAKKQIRIAELWHRYQQPEAALASYRSAADVIVKLPDDEPGASSESRELERLLLAGTEGLLRAETELKPGDREILLDLARKLVEFTGDEPRSLFLLGRALRVNDEDEAALETWRRALALLPDGSSDPARVALRKEIRRALGD